MIELTIMKPDGTLYWKDWFNDQAACNAWLATERTRPYWNPSFTVTVVALPNPAPILDDPNKDKKQTATTLAPFIAKAKSQGLNPSEVADALKIILLDLYT